MKSKLLFFVIPLLLIVFIPVIHFGKNQLTYSSNIVDVSWPNCSSKNNVIYNQGIIGVTGGLNFHQNPCLSKELTWFSGYDLYMNTGYPGNTLGIRYISSPLACVSTDSICLAYNYGYNAAKYALKYADLNNAHSLNWWLDVESDNSWSSDINVKRC